MMLPCTFFQQHPLVCAQELIGCELVWNECAGIIVETEAYTAVGDEAAHTFFKPSTRVFVEVHVPGTSYVYLNYGMYWLLNVLVKGGPADGFVLIRAIQPTVGIARMVERRSVRRPFSEAKPTALCSGPGKLSIALGIDGRDHARPLCGDESVGFRARKGPVEVTTDVRIGITRAADFPWRFLLKDSRYVSVPIPGNRKARPLQERSGF